MGLFGKSNGEKIVDNLVGTSNFKDYFIQLLEINDLKISLKRKDEYFIAYDIQNILKNKVKNKELDDNEIELYFYFLIKQSIYIKTNNVFFRVVLCPNCNKTIEDSNCVLSCPYCKTSFFHQYVIDYDKLNEIKINLPQGENPYKSMDDELEQYILKYKPNSLKEKLDPYILHCSQQLGVSADECYLVEIRPMLIKHSTEYNQVSVLAIFNDKVSFIYFGEKYPTGNISIYDEPHQALHWDFEDSQKINYTDDIIQFVLSERQSIIIKHMNDKTFSKTVINTFNEFNDSQTINEEINNTNEETNDIYDDVNPMEKIKEAKELFDMGAISEEEFEEIKNKYLKHA